MVLPTGSISFANLNTELQRAAGQSISLNDSQVRQIANKSSGSISMNDLRGKSYFRVSGGSTAVFGAGSRLGAGSVAATTNAASGGTVEGGQSPYSFSWEYVSGTAATINSPNSGTTTFSRSASVLVGEMITRTGVYRCKITDGNGIVIYGPNCTVTTQHSETT